MGLVINDIEKNIVCGQRSVAVGRQLQKGKGEEDDMLAFTDIWAKQNEISLMALLNCFTTVHHVSNPGGSLSH